MGDELSLSLTRGDWVVCLTVVVGSILAGLYLSFRTRQRGTSAGFFLAGRTLAWPIVGAP